jgi:hypothetical protein
MANQKRLYLPTLKIIPNIIPKRLHRSDVPDYLLSRTFERRFGTEFPRREVLIKLAAAATAIAIPVRPARALSVPQILRLAKGTLECGVAGFELFDDVFHVGRHTNTQMGRLMLTIANLDHLKKGTSFWRFLMNPMN